MRFTRPAVAFAAALTLATAACGSGSGSGSSGGGDDGGDVVIGTSLALSGGTNLETIRDGYQWAVDEVNDAGGIDVGGSKRQVSLKVLDNRNDTSTMVQQVRSLVLEDDAAALLGSCCQQNIDMSAQADALTTPLVMGALPVELAPESKGYTWDSFQSLADGANGFYEVADQTASNKKVVIVTNNDAQGTGTAQLWTQLAEAHGYQVVTTSAEPTGTTDFSDFIGKAKSADGTILVASMVPQDCFAMWNQMKALAYQPTLAIGLQCAQTPGWTQLGDVGAGALIQTNWTPTSGLPKAEDVVAKYQDKYSNLNDQASVALGYHEASLLLQAIANAGSTDHEKINDAIGQLSDFSSALGDVSWKGNLSTTPSFIGQWGADGSITQVWPAEGAGQLVYPVPGLTS